MPYTKPFLSQLRGLFPVLAISYLILFCLLAAVVVVSRWRNIEVESFLRDPLAVAALPPFVGALSNIGILLWCSTAAICFFSSYLLARRNNREIFLFLFFAGLLTSLLLFDDLFMLHEKIFPYYMHVPQTGFYVMYICFVILYLYRFYKLIFSTEYILLALSLGFFAISVFCDVFISSSDLEYLIEDGAKLFGISTWFIYFVRTCLVELVKESDE